MTDFVGCRGTDSTPIQSRSGANVPVQVPFTANNAVSILFILAALVAFPLWSKNSYDKLAQDKLDFFIPIVISFLVLSAVVLLVRVMIHPSKTLHRPEAFTGSDAMMLLFFIAVVVSWKCSKWPEEAYWGSDYRHHGVVIVAMYILVYFLISRFARRINWVPAVFLLGGGFLLWVGFQNFLGNDPLKFASHSSVKAFQTGIATLGNRNFFMSYVCMYLALSSIMFLKSKKIVWTLFYGTGVFVGFCALIYGRSDSGFFGLAVLLLVLPFFISNWKQFAHFAFIPGLLFLAGKALLLAVSSNGGKTKFSLGGFSEILMSGISGWIFLIVCAGIAVFFLILHKAKPDASFPRAPKVIWGIVLAASAFVVIMTVIYFSTINTTANLGKLEKYLRFNDSWGSTRGFAWIRAIREYADYDALQKLFGTGIDTAKHLFLPKYYQAMIKLSGLTFENVHNEYLQYLVTIGLVGAVGYIGLIASVVTRAFRRANKSKVCLALGMAVLCYAAQGVFNITQTMTTPIFFTLLALAEACSREVDANLRLARRARSAKPSVPPVSVEIDCGATDIMNLN